MSWTFRISPFVKFWTDGECCWGDYLILDFENLGVGVALKRTGSEIKFTLQWTVLVKNINHVGGAMSTEPNETDPLTDTGQMKAAFVSTISHELRTPLNGVLAATELLLEKSNLDPEARMLGETIFSSGKNLMVVVDQLVDFARLEAGKMKAEKVKFDFHPVVQDSIDFVAQAASRKGLDVFQEVDQELYGKEFLGDAALIKKLYVNLLDNAVKFTDKGSVRIKVELVTANGGPLKVKSTITDTGPGISERDQVRLFKPFVQSDSSNSRRYGGTGLGLSLSRGYVKLMGGEIGCNTEEKKGSSFWFSVPLEVSS